MGREVPGVAFFSSHLLPCPPAADSDPCAFGIFCWPCGGSSPRLAETFGEDSVVGQEGKAVIFQLFKSSQLWRGWGEGEMRPEEFRARRREWMALDQLRVAVSSTAA